MADAFRARPVHREEGLPRDTEGRNLGPGAQELAVQAGDGHCALAAPERQPTPRNALPTDIPLDGSQPALTPQQMSAPLPDGWQGLRGVVLTEELKLRVRTLRQVPRVIRGDYARIQSQVLAAIVRAQENNPDKGCYNNL